MPIIAGIDSKDKELLIKLCKHKRLTQVEWVKQNIEKDLNELAKEGIDVGTTLSPLPTHDKA